jgi:hypothetical protein
VVTTASHGPSLSARVRTIALAGAIAIGGILPAALTASADGGTDPGTTGVDTSPATSDGFDISGDSGLSGLTAVIAGGGERVNLRQVPNAGGEIVTKLEDGTTVELRVDRLDTFTGSDGIRWWPVSVDGVDGWVSGFYLAGSEAPVVASAEQFTLEGDDLTGRTALINGGGDGINLRAAPGHDGEVIDVLGDGVEVALRIDTADTVYDADGVTRWWPVAVDGVEGWVSGFYLRDADTAPVEPAAPVDPSEPAEPAAPAEPAEPAGPQGEFSLDGDDLTGRTAVVAGGGDGVNLRNAPSDEAGVILEVTDGTVVNLQVDQFDTVLDEDGTRWWPVEVNGAAGWISGFFLTDADNTEGDLSGQPATTTFVADSFVAVETIEGIGANVRADAAPSGRDVGSLREGAVVRVVEGPASFENSANGWYLITSGQLTGYVDGDLLTATSAPAEAADDAAAASADFADGDFAAASTPSGVGVNVREGASRLTTRLGFVPEAGVVQITDGPEFDEDGDPWYRVTDGELSGWVAANLLAEASAPPLEEEEPEAPAEPEGVEEPEPAPVDPEPAPVGGGLIYPVDGTITQNFGCSDLPYYEFDPDFGCAVHDGLDIAAPEYTPLVAADSGTVTFAGLCDCGLGYYVEIDHGGGIVTQYGHMAEQPSVAVGQQVSQGEFIGPLGSSGTTTGPHVHFVVKENGVNQDPLNYLP